MTKTCSRCGEKKALAEFRPRKNSPVGYYAACRPCERKAGTAAAKRWRERNPDKVKAANAKHRAENPDYANSYYAANREKLRRRYRNQMRRYRKTNPEAESKRKRDYRQRHPERVAEADREKVYSRRAKMPFSPGLASFMAELVTQPCAYCGAAENITIDHIVPLSQGGKHEAENLAPACFSCNSSKGAKPLADWLEERAA